MALYMNFKYLGMLLTDKNVIHDEISGQNQARKCILLI